MDDTGGQPPPDVCRKVEEVLTRYAVADLATLERDHPYAYLGLTFHARLDECEECKRQLEQMRPPDPETTKVIEEGLGRLEAEHADPAQRGIRLVPPEGETGV